MGFRYLLKWPLGIAIMIIISVGCIKLPISLPNKIKVYVYAIDDVNRFTGYLIDTVPKIPGAQIRVDYPGGSRVLTTTSTFPGPYIEVGANSTVTVSLVGEPPGWRFAGYWDIFGISWTPGPTRTFNVGTTDKHVAASFTPVSGASDFTLSVVPAAVTVKRGDTAAASILITRVNWPDPVIFTVRGLPPGLAVTVDPAATTGNSALLTFFADTNAIPGSYGVIVEGSSAGKTVSVQIIVNII